MMFGITLLACLLAILFPPIERTRLRALARQIANADRVVLTNSLEHIKGEFSDTEAQKLIFAVSHSQIIPTVKGAEYNCPGGMYLGFYRGTNLLAQVPGHYDHFHISETFYHDGSGALHRAWNVLNNE